MKKKILAMLLLSSMLISTFASCSEGGENTEETPVSDVTAPAAEEVVEEVEEEITLESTFADLGIDSLDSVELLMEMEDELNASLELDQKVETVGELVAFIEKKTKA